MSEEHEKGEMIERKEHSAITESILYDSSPAQVPAVASRKKKNSIKRRFSDEQVKSLETIFETETKLEPGKKVQVARDLGLQPRQVAIWFQNRRARWKSKQIEKNFRVLKANFDHLKARYEYVKEEKESLHAQLQELNIVLQKTRDHRSSNISENFEENNYLEKDQARGNQAAAGFEVEPRTQHEELNCLQVCCSDDIDKCRNIASSEQEEPERLDIVCGNLVLPPVKWCSFDSGNLFDHQTTNSSYWWEWDS